MLKNILIVTIIFVLFSVKTIYKPEAGAAISSVRVDDVLILISVLLLVFMGRTRSVFERYKKTHYMMPAKLIVLFSIWQLCVGLINIVLYDELSIVQVVLYSLRHTEYLCLFFIAFHSGMSSKFFNSIAIVYTAYILLFILAQKFGYLGGVTSFNAVQRQTGNLSGPFALAAVSSFFIFFFIKSNLKVIWMFAVFASLARITIVATFLVWVWSYVFSNYKFVGVKLFAVIGLFAGVFVMMTNLNLSYESGKFNARFSGLATAEILLTPVDLYQQLPSVNSQNSYRNYDNIFIKSQIQSVEYDASAFTRFSRWALAIKTLTSYGVQHAVFGLGPSFVGNALDGSYLRIFVESGLIGFMLYIMFIMSLLKVFKRDYIGKNYLYVLIVTGLFIDIFYSFKAMALLWIYFGVRLRALTESGRSER